VAAAEDPRQESSCLEIWIRREKPIQRQGEQGSKRQGSKGEKLKEVLF
jgi:hypothetical protein